MSGTVGELLVYYFDAKNRVLYTFIWCKQDGMPVSVQDKRFKSIEQQFYFHDTEKEIVHAVTYSDMGDGIEFASDRREKSREVPV